MGGSGAAMPQDTELHKVAKDGDTQSCTETIQGGANVNAVGAQGRTALHRALAGGCDVCAAALLDSGADATIADSMKRTSLIYAVLGPDTDAAMRCLEVLFERQEEALLNVINHATKSGTTALHCATEKKAVDMVRFLVERGADPNLKDDDDKSSIDIAKEKKLPKDLFDMNAGNRKKSMAAGGDKKGGFFGRRRTSTKAGGSDEVKL